MTYIVGLLGLICLLALLWGLGRIIIFLGWNLFEEDSKFWEGLLMGCIGILCVVGIACIVAFIIGIISMIGTVIMNIVK